MSSRTLEAVAEVESRGHKAIVLSDQDHDLGVIEIEEAEVQQNSIAELIERIS